jgi:DNA-binding IclR family transcriptional regulator
MSDMVKETLYLLEIFCEKIGPLGITEISNIMIESKSSIFKKIQTLLDLGFIMQDQDSKKYRLTTKFLELVNKSLESYHSKTNINSYLKLITEKTGESSYFGIKNQNNRLIYIDINRSNSLVVINTNIGDSPLPHCTAHGKALLAFLDMNSIEDVIKGGLEKFTKNTITDKNRLLEELRKIREIGYAIDNEEREVGFKCIAAPVFNSKKEVIGAIGISGTTRRFTQEKIRKFAESVKEIADKISINIGNDLLF